MNQMQRVAFIASLTKALHINGSWCGETHIQKATYFLQELLNVPIGLGFILYKYGPFSFDLRDQLTAMRADGLLKLQVRPEHYGPSILLTDLGNNFCVSYPITTEKYSQQIQFVALKLGNRCVAELERLATALYVSKNAIPNTPKLKLANEINHLKPHVTIIEAQKAVDDLDLIVQEADSFICSSNGS